MDDTEMTNEEFEAGMTSGPPAQVVTSRMEFEIRTYSAPIFQTSSINVGSTSLVVNMHSASVVTRQSFSGDLVDALP